MLGNAAKDRQYLGLSIPNIPMDAPRIDFRFQKPQRRRMRYSDVYAVVRSCRTKPNINTSLRAIGISTRISKKNIYINNNDKKFCDDNVKSSEEENLNFMLCRPRLGYGL